MTTIERLRALLDEATPGPWEACLREDEDTGPILMRRQHTVIAHRPEVGLRGLFSAVDLDPRDRENAALVVAAVNALRALLDERDALREALRLYHVQHDDECNCEACNAYDDVTDEVEGPLDRLEGAS